MRDLNPQKTSFQPFGQPQSEKDIQAVKESHVLKKTLQNTGWAQSIWRDWGTHRLKQPHACMYVFMLPNESRHFS